MKLKALVAAAATVFAFASAASAAVTGTYTIDIYNFDAGGDPNQAYATDANVTAHAADLLTTITYTGPIDFQLNIDDPNTILTFLQSGGGTVSDPTGLDVLMSASDYGTTTLLDITGTITAGMGQIYHDDGITLYNNDAIVAQYAQPTGVRPTDYTVVDGTMRLIYSATNNEPERLTMTRVPVPAAGFLLLGALGGMAAMKRRKKSA